MRQGCSCGDAACPFWRAYITAKRTEDQLWKQADKASEYRREASEAHSAHLLETVRGMAA